MVNYEIEKKEDGLFNIKIYKIVKDRNDNDVEILDDTITTTLATLEDTKIKLQQEIIHLTESITECEVRIQDIEDKISEINKIKGE